jgi:thiol-disulfide isomerase/thioredoxin
MNQKSIIIGGAVVLIALSGVLYAMSSPKKVDIETPATVSGNVVSAPTPVAKFAQCLKDEGAIFYGAFWCPHCKSQKALFGDAESQLPYVECSTLDGNSQTQICRTRKIESYPTWEFKNGTRSTGVLSFAELAEKTGCVAPAAP